MQKKILALFFILFFSQNAMSVRIGVGRAEQFKVRTFDGVSLNSTNESVPDPLYFEIPDQFVIRFSSGLIDLERSLETWRLSSRGTQGSPLVYPEAIGDCSYQFGGRVGCDMYPYKNDNGETRYLALRFMAREAEKTSLDESDFEIFSMPNEDGTTGPPEKFYNRSVFMEMQSDGVRLIHKPVNLETGVRPDPIILGGERGFVRLGVAAIQGYVDYTEADADKGVSCGTGQNPLQCLICNCYHETGITNDEDKLAVGKVVMTRIGMESYNRDGKSNVCDMIYGDAHRSQFSWFYDGKKDEDVTGENFKTCLPLMKEALAFRGHFASHYHANWLDKEDVSWLTRTEGNSEVPNCRGKVTVTGTKNRGHTFYEICDQYRTPVSNEIQLRGLGVSQ